MTDALGTRAVFAVLLPATNSMVEPDLASLRPPGVTFQTFRFPFPALPAEVETLADLMGSTLELCRVCEPDQVVLGYSPEYMAEPAAVTGRLRQLVAEATGLPFTLAFETVPEALRCFGATRLGVVTPFPAAADERVRSWFTAQDFTIERMLGLASAQKGKVYTARISAAEIRDAFLAVDGPGVEALVQVGTNLVCSTLVEQLEAELGKPVLAVNTATAWAALRQHGISDRLSGWGRLLSQH
jgi:maleate isomerase